MIRRASAAGSCTSDWADSIVRIWRDTRTISWSAGLTLIALLVFGAVKGRFSGVDAVKSALQTALVGSVAASAAYFLARLVNKFG